jgi:hypothetical protein
MPYYKSDPYNMDDEYYMQGSSYLDPIDMNSEYSQQQGFGASSGSSGMLNAGFSTAKAASGLINPLIPIGLNLGSGILRALKGKSEAEKRADRAGALRERTAKGMQGEIGKDVFSPDKYLAMIRQRMIPRAKQLGASADKRFGFDQGRGYGSFLESLTDEEAQGILDFAKMNDQAKFERDMRYKSSLLNFQG